MNLKGRLAITCGVLGCLAAILLWPLATAKHSLPVYTYSQFLDQVRGGHVSSVIVTGAGSSAVDATFQLKDGRAARTVLPPDYKDAFRAMQDKFVNIEIRGASSDPRYLLANAAPFLVLVGMWIVLMIAKFPNGPFRRTGGGLMAR